MKKINRIIIVDSSALFSLFIETDKNYARATRISQKIKKSGTILIAKEIFSEFVNIAGKKLNHVIAIGAATFILRSKIFTLQDSTEQIIERALEKFHSQPSSVSFTDCLVMAFADHFETKDIFGFDESFKKNGYKRIGID